MTDALATVLAAAASHAAEIERLADQPFRLLSTRTPHDAVVAWQARERERAAVIRRAIAEIVA